MPGDSEYIVLPVQLDFDFDFVDFRDAHKYRQPHSIYFMVIAPSCCLVLVPMRNGVLQDMIGKLGLLAIPG